MWLSLEFSKNYIIKDLKRAKKLKTFLTIEKVHQKSVGLAGQPSGFPSDLKDGEMNPYK